MCANNCKCNGAWCGCCVSIIMKVLVIVGGLNWGLVGVGMLMETPLNLVNLLLGSWPVVEAVVYILVGIAALGSICGCKCSKCTSSCSTCKVEEKAPEMNKM